MKYKEFLDYLEENLEGYHVFMDKAVAYQDEKNKKRPSKNRWDNKRVHRASYDMWRQSMEPLYNNIKHDVESDLPTAWISFIDKNNIFETVNDGISELNFSEEQ